MKPESVAYTPYLPLDKKLPSQLEFFRLRGRIGPWSRSRCGWAAEQFSKGLAVHSRTEAVYYLPGRFHRFRTTAGIDDDFRPRGSVPLILRGEGKTLWEATLSGAEPPRAIDVDVTGVRRLTILADFTGDLDVAGHAILGDARVSK